jgi:hypothetical protein
MTLDAPATGDGERAYVDRPFSLVCLDEAATSGGDSPVATVARSTPRWTRWAGSGAPGVTTAGRPTSGTPPTREPSKTSTAPF